MSNDPSKTADHENAARISEDDWTCQIEVRRSIAAGIRDLDEGNVISVEELCLSYGLPV